MYAVVRKGCTRLVCEGTNSASFAYFLSAVQFTPWAVATAADKTAYYKKFGQDAAVPRGIAASESNGLPKTYVVRTEEGPVPGGVEYAYEDDYVICTDASVGINVGINVGLNETEEVAVKMILQNPSSRSLNTAARRRVTDYVSAMLPQPFLCIVAVGDFAYVR